MYANDWDSAEDKTGCGSGCAWTFEEYVGRCHQLALETNHSTGATGGGNNDANVCQLHQPDRLHVGRRHEDQLVRRRERATEELGRRHGAQRCRLDGR